MSYDVWMEADLGGPEPVAVELLEINYTYNVSKMFSAAIGETPSKWNGKPASEVREACLKILAAFEADPAKFQAMNPENGWGDFDGARNFIRSISDACQKAPRAIVRVG